MRTSFASFLFFPRRVTSWELGVFVDYMTNHSLIPDHLAFPWAKSCTKWHLWPVVSQSSSAEALNPESWALNGWSGLRAPGCLRSLSTHLFLLPEPLPQLSIFGVCLGRGPLSLLFLGMECPLVHTHPSRRWSVLWLNVVWGFPRYWNLTTFQRRKFHLIMVLTGRSFVGD